jgi:NADH:ubiquinone oxidoreductase subunit E
MAWDLNEALQYYKKQGAPGDQSALLGLLRELQHESGGSIPQGVLSSVAKELDTKESYLLAVIRRIPSLRLSQQHVLELCAGPNCGKHTQLAAYAEELQRRFGGRLRVKFVPCMRQCGHGPNIKWDGQLHNRATKELLEQLTKDL